MSRDAVYRFGSLSLDPAARQLQHRGHSIHLTPKEFDLLALLVANAGRVVTKEEIHHAVWHDAAVEEGNLTQTICLLRKVMHEAGLDDAIDTVPRHGYLFVPSVKLTHPLPRARSVLLKVGIPVLVLALWAILFFWLGARG